MSDLAIRVENLSKLYPEPSATQSRRCLRPGRAGHIGLLQQRHDTTSADLCAAPRRGSAGLRDALTSRFRRAPHSPNSHSANSAELWALRDVSFEACPEGRRRIQRGEVVGTPALASGAMV